VNLGLLANFSRCDEFARRVLLDAADLDGVTLIELLHFEKGRVDNHKPRGEVDQVLVANWVYLVILQTLECGFSLEAGPRILLNCLFDAAQLHEGELGLLVWFFLVEVEIYY
jgi:hypothetical protein